MSFKGLEPVTDGLHLLGVFVRQRERENNNANPSLAHPQRTASQQKSSKSIQGQDGSNTLVALAIDLWTLDDAGGKSRRTSLQEKIIAGK